MDRPNVIGAAGYPSIDRIVRLKSSAQVGRTSLIANDDFARTYFGGCGVNICYVLAKLGVQAFPFMNVGDDFDESGYCSALSQPGLNLSGVRRVPGVHTSSSILLEDACGQHITLFYEGAMCGELAAFRCEELVNRIDLGVITVGDLGYNLAFLQALQRMGKQVAFSMKFDAHAFPKEQLEQFLQASHYIFMNESEAADICACMGYQSVGQLFCTPRQQCVVVTQGAEGCQVMTREGETHVPAAKEKRKGDHAGVGDAFVAGFLCGLTQGRNAVACAQLGAVTASFVLEEKGCLNGAPALAQVLNREKENY